MAWPALLVIIVAPAVAQDSLARLSGERPMRESNGIPVGGGFLYPSLFFGTLYDSNINQTQYNPQSGWGVRLVPSIRARWDNGIHATSLYALADARLYAGDAQNGKVTGRAGFVQDYRPLEDLAFKLVFDYTRELDYLHSILGLGKVDLPVPSNLFGIGVSSTANPEVYNQISGAASVRKDFVRAFMTLTTSVAAIKHDNTAPGTVNNDGTTFAVTGRIGSALNPFVYAFVEGGYNWRQYATSEFNSQGYRVTAGVGSDRVGLFAGEVYAGYQAQARDLTSGADASSPVLGGRVAYFPTRYVTVRANVDQALGVSTLVGSPSSPLGASTRTTNAFLVVTYAMSRYWSLAARVGANRTEFLDTAYYSRGWLVGATFQYTFWRNIALTFDYHYEQTDSNIPFNSYDRNVVSVGATYRY